MSDNQNSYRYIIDTPKQNIVRKFFEICPSISGIVHRKRFGSFANLISVKPEFGIELSGKPDSRLTDVVHHYFEQVGMNRRIKLNFY